MSADGRTFVDTNVLVYAYDASAGVKRTTSAELVTELWETREGCASVQVLQEFFVTVTRKLPHPLDGQIAVAVVQSLSEWATHAPDARDVVTAIHLHQQQSISFWDAMILTSASALGCERVLSEDLNPGQRYDGVLVVDPFAS